MPGPDLTAIAQRHGVSVDAARAVFDSLESTGGTSAQFNHSEFGGFGQWMPGMTQVGDMFNAGLRGRVEALCMELAQHARPEPAPACEHGVAREPRWWPESLGRRPNVTGAQNEVRYAWFADARRLVVDRGGTLTIYDTGGHRITGVAQAQDATCKRLIFSTAHGEIDLAALPVTSG